MRIRARDSARYTGTNRDISVRYRCSENEMSLFEFRRVLGPLHFNLTVATFAIHGKTKKAEAKCLGFFRWYARLFDQKLGQRTSECRDRQKIGFPQPGVVRSPPDVRELGQL